MQPPSACLASGVSSASMSSTVIVSWPLIWPLAGSGISLRSGSPAPAVLAHWPGRCCCGERDVC